MLPRHVLVDLLSPQSVPLMSAQYQPSLLQSDKTKWEKTQLEIADRKHG